MSILLTACSLTVKFFFLAGPTRTFSCSLIYLHRAHLYRASYPQIPVTLHIYNTFSCTSHHVNAIYIPFVLNEATFLCRETAHCCCLRSLENNISDKPILASDIRSLSKIIEFILWMSCMCVYKVCSRGGGETVILK